MMSQTAALIPPTSGDDLKYPGELPRRHGIMFLSILEMLACLSGTTLYIYALSREPSWAPLLVPLPEGICSSTNILHGFMYTFVLLFIMEFFQAICLFDGARRESLGRVCFWIYSMLTYMIILSIVAIGMELGGIHSPTMNSVVFINILIRFIEIMMVYAWVEHEAMTRLRQNVNGRDGERYGSTATIATMVDIEAAAPPPSYDSTLPFMLSQPVIVTSSPRPSTSAAAHQEDRILPVVVVEEGKAATNRQSLEEPVTHWVQ